MALHRITTYRAIMLPPPGSPAHALSRHPFLSGTSAEVLTRAAARARWIDARPDQAIVDFEDATTEVFLIMQGSVRVLLSAVNGDRTQILGDFSAGDLVGEMSAIDSVPRSARIEALVRTRLCGLPAAAFLDVVFSSREIGLRLFRLLTSRVRDQNRRMLEFTTLPIRLRLLAELLRLSRPRPDGTRVLSPPLTQEELAARIGARRESVSREFAEMVELGLLVRSRSALMIPNPAALQEIVSQALD